MLLKRGEGPTEVRGALPQVPPRLFRLQEGTPLVAVAGRSRLLQRAAHYLTYERRVGLNLPDSVSTRRSLRARGFRKSHRRPCKYTVSHVRRSTMALSSCFPRRVLARQRGVICCRLAPFFACARSGSVCEALSRVTCTLGTPCAAGSKAASLRTCFLRRAAFQPTELEPSRLFSGSKVRLSYVGTCDYNIYTI